MVVLTMVLATMIVGQGHAQANDQLLQGGNKALNSGDHKKAVQLFTQAMGTGALKVAGTAEAYYKRGIAHRKLNKPANAIADINNALWLNALTPAQKAEALQNRAAAYEAVGYKSQAALDTATVRKLYASGVARTTANSNSASGGSSSGASAGALSPWQTSTTTNAVSKSTVKPAVTSQRPQIKPRLSSQKPARRDAEIGAFTTTVSTTKPVATLQKPAIKPKSSAKKSARPDAEIGAFTTSVKADTPVSTAQQPQKQSGNGVTAFFTNLFSAGQSNSNQVQKKQAAGVQDNAPKTIVPDGWSTTVTK